MVYEDNVYEGVGVHGLCMVFAGKSCLWCMQAGVVYDGNGCVWCMMARDAYYA